MVNSISGPFSPDYLRREKTKQKTVGEYLEYDYWFAMEPCTDVIVI